MVPMAERRDVPRETNPLIVALAEVAIAVLERRREVAGREETEAREGRDPEAGPDAARSDPPEDRS